MYTCMARRGHKSMKVCHPVAMFAFAAAMTMFKTATVFAGHHDHAAPAKATHAAKNDIVDTAVAAGSFNTLVAAVKAAGLVETLKGAGPFTVFAPTDAAFAKLPAGTLDALLADKDKLTKILTYHVVPGKLTGSDGAGLRAARTVEGSSLAVDTSNGVRVSGANVVTPDVVTSNGVIHVIDTVLIPAG